MKRLKEIEKISEEVLPIEEQFTIKTEPYIFKRVVYSDWFVEDRFLATELLKLFYEKYYDSPSEVHSILLIKLMILLTNLTNFGDNINEREGVFLAYYSFKSHVEGFKKSFNNFPSPKQLKLNEKIENFTTEEEDFINFGFRDFLSNSSEIEEYKSLFYSIKDIYSDQILRDEVNFSGEYSISNYFTQDENLSHYHLKLKSIADLEKLSQKEFILGRCMLNWFYSILPMFAISPIERHRLCNIIVKCVEKYRGKNWDELLVDFFGE